MNSPTRGKNILDLYFTNNPTLARQVKMIPGIGDHHSAIMVDSLIKPMVNKLQSRKVYQYHKGDWDSIKAGLTSFAPKFRSDCQKMNIDEMWNSFHSKMMSLRETYISSKTVKTQQSLPWINHVLRRLMRKQLRLFHRRTFKEQEGPQKVHRPQENSTEEDQAGTVELYK